MEIICYTLYVIGNSPLIGAVERFLIANWNFKEKSQIFYHNEDYFVLRFGSEDEQHVINNRPVVVKPWSKDFNLYDEVLSTIPLWVNFHKGMKLLSTIGSALGNPLYADDCTTNTERISFARVLIEMDITKPLPKTVKIQEPNGNIFTQEVTYDSEPEYCEDCLQIGHNCAKIQKRKQGPNKPVQRKKAEVPKVQQVWQGKEANGEVQGPTNPEKVSQPIAREMRSKGVTNIAHKGDWQTIKGKTTEKAKSSLGGVQTINTRNDFTPLPYSGMKPILMIGEMELGQCSTYEKGGDYNAVLNTDDRILGSPVQDSETKDFKEFLADTDMEEVKACGREYTWTNNHTYSRIDKAISDGDWLMMMPSTHVAILEPRFSDHSPLKVVLSAQASKPGRPFRFLYCLADHDMFLRLIASVTISPDLMEV
ncbi:hypothetical protein RND71_014593 [Anisodus tanguticus]|uniref:DUF4283 domain-containing protein n=1 Tax=Anisodus tanguticus TaxID=243964 RepID=A0AAE1VE87_9SOLA|nr:hypothetical protein RND71_014593 [Anisodus tanguticus]